MPKSSSGITSAPSPHMDVWCDLVSLLLQYNINPKVRAIALKYLRDLNKAGTSDLADHIAHVAREYLQTIL